MIRHVSPKRRETGGGPYDLAEITRRVEKEITRRELLDKEVASGIGISQGQLSHKLRMTKRSRLNIEDCSRLAELFKAPLGWPFLEWTYAEALQTAAQQVAQIRREFDALLGESPPPRKR